MKNLILILIVLINTSAFAQLEIECYTNYGYQADFENDKMYNIDGEQFYWYFKVDLGSTMYKPNNPDNVTEYNANGYFYRKDYLNKTNVKSIVNRVKVISYADNSISTIFYPSDNSCDSITLRKEQGGFKITMCINSKMVGGKETCIDAYIHSSIRFNDYYYLSKLPSQKID